MTLKTDTIVDAALIAAPSSTKNVEKKHDPDMHQTRKGQQWYFGIKLHIGVDSQSGLAPRRDHPGQHAWIKRLWSFTKVRYRGLAKNAGRAFTALALANIYLSRNRLMAQVRP